MSSVVETLKKYILVDGFHVVADLDSSHDSWIIDKETKKKYLDCYSQFASQALGWNHKSLIENSDYIKNASIYKLANSDMYSKIYENFMKNFASIAPDFKHFFFIEGGSLAVENALKAAFDWKCQLDQRHAMTDGQFLDVIHMKEAFHGRSGYTLSLTNTGEMKTKWFPKFKWTRVINPKITNSSDETEKNESICLDQMEKTLKKREVAAIIFETIQGEGGDNHFTPRLFKEVRKLADEYQAMFILDEVQCGMGLTGKWWAYEYYDVKPDMIVFGKKSQVCGFASNERIEEAKNNVFKQSSRINSTWGGNFVDMARSKIIIDIIKKENLVENSEIIGKQFLESLKELSIKYPQINNVRGKGLMIAFDLPDEKNRDLLIAKMQENMLVLKCGEKSIRFRPSLSFNSSDVNQAIEYIEKALQ